MINRWRAAGFHSLVAVAAMLSSAALPWSTVFYRCRGCGTEHAVPCCDHAPKPPGATAALETEHCCRPHTVTVDHSVPELHTAAGVPIVATLVTSIPPTSGALASRSVDGRACSTGPPWQDGRAILLRACTLII